MARDGAGIVLLGPSGCGKSDLALRLLDRGFSLVADDCVDIEGGTASGPVELAGLIEIRGLGIVRLPYIPQAHLVLAVTLGASADRLPLPARHPALDLPMIAIDPWQCSAAQRVEMALDCALGRIVQHTGAFAP